jgi:predicted dehydrogenase
LKILIIGPGSIGRRHLQNILQAGYKQVSVVSRSAKVLPQFPALPVYTSVEQALASSMFDAAVVCTPTSFHFQSVISLLKAEVPAIYIEKPVSHSLEGMAELIQLAKKNNTRIVVGFDLHFDPGMQKVKQLLSENIIGTVVSVNAQVGQYLPAWRPYEDYAKGMSAKKETGGGVMLDLIHEFDYLLWLFGSVSSVACQYQNTGALQIETEDVCEVLLRFENNSIGTIHLDYLQQKLVRNCMITGYDGSITWNMAESYVRWIIKGKKEETFSYAGYDRNDRFTEIITTFLENKVDDRLSDLLQGYESLRLVLAAKESADKNKFVQMASFHPVEIK